MLPCNARSTLTELKAIFPSFTWPDTMSESDSLHLPEDVRGQETPEEITARAAMALEEILDLSECSTCEYGTLTVPSTTRS